jgi:Hint domain
MLINEGAWSVEGSVASGGVPCLVSGTRVQTDTGEKRVEQLLPGSKLVTQSGALRSVQWIGRRKLDPLRQPRPEAVLPICIRRGAIATGLPRRDLYVSPAQPILLPAVAMSALHMVNGATIAVDRSPIVAEYVCIELAEPDILMAEGVPVACFPLVRTHSTFTDSPVVALHPILTPRPWGETPESYRRPAMTEMRRRLLQRAHVLGYVLTREADLHLLADGRKIQPTLAAESLCRFNLEEPASDIRIVSRAGVPAEVEAASCDARRLGVLLERVVLRSPDRVCVLGAEHPTLIQGFHPPERYGAHIGRWTDGHATLPLPPRVVCIDLHVLTSQAAWAWALPPAAPLNRSA